MRLKLVALSALAVLTFATTEVFAQAVGTQSRVPNLSGWYRCVRRCAGAGPIHIVQRGWALSVTNEIGQHSEAWIDGPGHIWLESWKQGAVYSPGGFTIQFYRGPVWVLVIPTPIPGYPD